MPYASWTEATANLRKRLDVTDEQRRIAGLLGLAISDNTPRYVAAYLLRRELAPPLLLAETPRSRHRPDYVNRLVAEVGIAGPSLTDEAELIDAWVQSLWDIRSMQALERLQLGAGDLVSDIIETDERIELIASISEDGQVNFKGGRGRRARPHRLRLIAAASDTSSRAQDLRRAIDERIALEQPISSLSVAKLAQLRDFAISAPIRPDDVGALEDTIDSATDERPIQRLIGERPVLLSSLLGNRHDVFVVPLPNLGARYIPDFVVAAVDSAGIHWYVVELQSPLARIALKDGSAFAEQTREAVAQIQTWREWLSHNLDQARRSRRDQGLNLPDIRPNPPGVVFVGRRTLDQDPVEGLRNRTLEENNISIHTYDWLIEAVHDSLQGIWTPYGPLERAT